MRMGHELKMVFSNEEIKHLRWPNAFMDVLAETLSRGMTSGEIRTMSPQLLAMQFSGALFHGLSHFIHSVENQDGYSTNLSEPSAQDIKDATASCMAILQSDAKSF